MFFRRRKVEPVARFPTIPEGFIPWEYKPPKRGIDIVYTRDGTNFHFCNTNEIHPTWNIAGVYWKLWECHTIENETPVEEITHDPSRL